MILEEGIAEPTHTEVEIQNPVEFALTEIFNYYNRRYLEKSDYDFEKYEDNLQRLGMRGYIAFVKDMQINIDKQRVIEAWKKTSVNN